LLDSPELRDLLPQLTRGLYESLGEKTALEYIEIFFKYLVKATEVVGKEDYKRALKILPEGGMRVMTTLAEEWKQEGRQEILVKKDQWEREAEKKGEIRTTQEMIIEYIQDELDIPSQKLIDKIRAINSYDLLRGLFRKARKVNSLDEFVKEVEKVFN
jgi:uncharacterized protein (DUF2235 family)